MKDKSLTGDSIAHAKEGYNTLPFSARQSQSSIEDYLQIILKKYFKNTWPKRDNILIKREILLWHEICFSPLL